MHAQLGDLKTNLSRIPTSRTIVGKSCRLCHHSVSFVKEMEFRIKVTARSSAQTMHTVSRSCATTCTIMSPCKLTYTDRIVSMSQEAHRALRKQYIPFALAYGIRALSCSMRRVSGPTTASFAPQVNAYTCRTPAACLRRAT
jgi:hypothetical protein